MLALTPEPKPTTKVLIPMPASCCTGGIGLLGLQLGEPSVMSRT